jgi:hypothetical protein
MRLRILGIGLAFLLAALRPPADARQDLETLAA